MRVDTTAFFEILNPSKTYRFFANQIVHKDEAMEMVQASLIDGLLKELNELQTEYFVTFKPHHS